MVTPRIVYTKDERRRKILGSLELISAYDRKNSEAIAVTIRYEPHLQKVTHNDKLTLFYSREPFFLSKLHYEQLLFSMQCLGWTLNITEKDFDEVLDDFVRNLPKEHSLILRIIFRKNGRVDGSAERAKHLHSVFGGLLEQIRLSQMDTENGYTAITETKKFACIDTDSTLPCYSTTFDLEDSRPYEIAYRRICDYHACLLSDEYQPTEASVNKVDSDAGRESDNDDFSAEVRDEIIDDIDLSEELTADSTLKRSDVEDKLSKVAAIQRDIKEGRRGKISNEELRLDEVVPGYTPGSGKAEHLELLKTIELFPIMYNPMHQVMSSGIWVLCFFRDGKWYTPHVSTGCRCDPLRMVLLEAGLIEEAVIRVQGLEQDEDILLISSAYGIHRARLFGEAPEELYKYTRNRKPKSKAKTGGRQKAISVAQAELTSLSLTPAAPLGRKIPNTNVFKISAKKGRPRI